MWFQQFSELDRISWRRLTGLIPSDTPGCDHSGWRLQGSIAWTLFCSWPAANAAGSGSAWHGRSNSGRTPVWQLHSGRAVVAVAWTLAVPPTRCYSSPAWTLWTPGPAAVWLPGRPDDEPSADDECGRSKQQQFWLRVLSSSALSPYRRPDPGWCCWAVCYLFRLAATGWCIAVWPDWNVSQTRSSQFCRRSAAVDAMCTTWRLQRHSWSGGLASASTSELLS